MSESELKELLYKTYTEVHRDMNNPFAPWESVTEVVHEVELKHNKGKAQVTIKFNRDQSEWINTEDNE